jgi:predicted molibdopterin-dependent oxidoreductase YjgC
MITAGVLAQFQTGTMSRHCPTLNKVINEPFVGMHKDDAKELNIKNGDMLELSAPNGGVIQAKAKISDEVKRKYVFVPVNFNEARVNYLTSEKLIDISKTPEYKGAIVNLKKV